jgi:hypothetical protein
MKGSQQREGERGNLFDTECQWPLSGIHSIMMEKSAQPADGGGCTPVPFYYIYHHAPAEKANLPLFLLYPYMYSVHVATSH